MPSSTVATEVARLPGTTGFIEIRGKADYDPRRQALTILLNFIPAPLNYETLPSYREERLWKGKSRDFKAMRELLAVLVETYRKKVLEGWPGKSDYLSNCASSRDPATVLEKQCARCTSPHCLIIN